MNKRLFFIFLLGTVLLSGCWSKKELTDLALVAGLGIEKNEEGKYVGTIQVVNPGNVAEGQQGGGSGQGPPVSVYSATGDNIIEASRELSTKVSRRLYYAHTNLVVIDEQLAREEGITKILDAMDRDPEFRVTTTVIIAHGVKAGDIMKALTPIDKIPSSKIIKTLKFTEESWGEHLNVNIKEIINALTSSGKEPLITGFHLVGDHDEAKKMESIQQTAPAAIIQTNGLAVFKEGKLIGWIHGEAAKGSVWILDRIKRTNVTINWKEEKGAISYQVMRQKTNISARMQDGQPIITVEVRAEGDIGEVIVPIDLTDPHVFLEIEKGAEEEIKKEIEQAVQEAKEYKSDVFGFGEAVRRLDPDAWETLKAEWDDRHFPELQVEVKVDAFVRRSGLRNKSFLSQTEENR